jgi:hypothetical protein
LKAAFNSSFIEGQTQTYQLKDVLPSTFRLLVQWLYSNNFKVAPTDRHRKGWEEFLAATEAQYNQLVQLWVLAERMIILRLQNKVMGEFLHLLEQQRTTAWIPIAYAGTMAGSPLRQLAVDICLYKISSIWIKAHPDHFPQEMLLDLAASVNLREGKDNTMWIHKRTTKDYFVREGGVQDLK